MEARHALGFLRGSAALAAMGSDYSMAIFPLKVFDTYLKR
jgi:hypothetical protein